MEVERKLHFLLKEGFHAWELVPFGLDASAVAAALAFVPRRPIQASK
jgi:hypothetical protein